MDLMSRLSTNYRCNKEERDWKVRYFAKVHGCFKVVEVKDAIKKNVELLFSIYLL